MPLNIPNMITLLRVFLIPVFIASFFMGLEHRYLISAFIFWFAAGTDILDGYLARVLNQSTKFGAFLDPVADKVMVSAALVMLSQDYQNIWITIPAIIMISREIIISALREWMAELGQRGIVAVSVWGKIKTAAQMLAIIALLSRYNETVINIGYGLMYVAVVLTITSMISYLWLATKAVNKESI